MGDADRSATSRSRGQQAVGLNRGADGNRTRSVGRLGDSSVRATPLARIRSSFLDQPVEATGRHVSLQLPIPFLGVELREPSAKRSSLLVRKLLNGVFNLLNCTHGCSLFRSRTRCNHFLDAIGLTIARRFGKLVGWPSQAVLREKGARLIGSPRSDSRLLGPGIVEPGQGQVEESGSRFLATQVPSFTSLLCAIHAPS